VPAPTATALKGVGRVIAVASGKGGVGKSTVAVNLALALRRLGFTVGLLDIDIYGPSLPTLLGINERPNVVQRRIVPPQMHGLRLMSLGFLMDEDTPVIWRGPIVTGIVRQFLQDVDWEGTDYLVVDLPPGTGDAQLSLAQTVPVDAAIVVTTPSDLALVDAARGLRMFNTLNVDVLGIVENMAWYQWPGAGEANAAISALRASGADSALLDRLQKAVSDNERLYIFGRDGGPREATRLGTPFLGHIPLDGTIRSGGDSGQPVMVSAPDSAVARAFVDLAEKVAAAKPLEREQGAPRKGLFSFLKS
jgi:ATP-binding protein involved in chromosome partitioning